MNPIITSNRYVQTSDQFVKLYWGELLRQHWFLLILFPLIFVGNCVISFLHSSYIGYVDIALALIIFLVLRWRFISGLRKNRAFTGSCLLTVYSDRLILDNENGLCSVFHFKDIVSFKSLKTHYRIRLNSKNLFWIPKNVFKNEEGKRLFEELVGVI